MDHDDACDEGRRFFITRILPGCALTCAGLGAAGAAAAGPTASQLVQPFNPYAHKFDMPYGEQMSYREYYRTKYEEMVRLVRDLSGELGKSNLLQMIMTTAEQRSLVLGNAHAEKVPVNDFATYIGMFREPAYQQIMTMQIVEDAPAAFEVRITECLWASTFKDLEAADIGYAHICHADFTWAEGFNPAIKLTRDQTLMQGHASCNHRYTWES